jgi:S-adenosylmethionine synthetase
MHQLNISVPNTLAQLSTSSSNPFTLVYISTDYVFPGNAPPAGYATTDQTEPLQLYGETKLAGEQALVAVEKESIDLVGRRVILRVPVLYGPCEKPSDSAVNILLDVVKDNSGKEYKMDHWAVRYPTNVSLHIDLIL